MENQNNNFEELTPYVENGKEKKDLMEDIIKPIFSFLGGTILIGLFILGEYHSCTKHKDDSDLITYSPLVLYRGVEFFWHNDFAGVNWDEKLKDDGRYCIYLFHGSIDESVNPQELSKNSETFKKNINKYPKDKLDVLKSFSRLYFKYQLAMFSNIVAAFQTYLSFGEANLSHSGDMQIIENKLRGYLHEEDIMKMNVETNSGFTKFNEMFPQLDALSETEKNERLKNMVAGIVYVQSKYSAEFKKLFDEDL
ncbi:MAG: hypothetical protein ABII93_05740 [Chrysiogenia bacterium]